MRRGPPQPDIVGWASLPVGVVTLAERYGGTVVPREVYHAMVDEVAALVQRFADEHRGDFDDGFHMLGTSGTVTTIAGVFLRLRRYDRRRVDGCWLSDDQVSRVVGELMAMSFDERAANPCIAPSAPTSFSPAAPSSMPSAVSFRASGCVLPIAVCARACWSR